MAPETIPISRIEVSVHRNLTAPTKEQIVQETSRGALHVAEVIKFAKDHGERGGTTAYPEAEFIAPRIQAQKRSMLRAGIITGAVIAAGVYYLLRRK